VPVVCAQQYDVPTVAGYDGVKLRAAVTVLTVRWAMGQHWVIAQGFEGLRASVTVLKGFATVPVEKGQQTEVAPGALQPGPAFEVQPRGRLMEVL